MERCQEIQYWRPDYLGRSPTIGDVYDECEHAKFACLGHRGCLVLSLLATKA